MGEGKTPNQATMRAERHRWERGQIAVEVAIVAPLLALVLVICADFGRVFYTNVEVDNAARAGAQYGSQTTATAANTTNIATAAIAGAPNIGLTSASISSSVCSCESPTPSGFSACSTASTTPYCTDSPSANYVTVTATATYHTILAYPGIPSSTKLTGTATMQILQAPSS
jgi:Flp pilus assembly protein TadG